MIFGQFWLSWGPANDQPPHIQAYHCRLWYRSNKYKQRYQRRQLAVYQNPKMLLLSHFKTYPQIFQTYKRRARVFPTRKLTAWCERLNDTWFKKSGWQQKTSLVHYQIQLTWEVMKETNQSPINIDAASPAKWPTTVPTRMKLKVSNKLYWSALHQLSYHFRE